MDTIYKRSNECPICNTAMQTMFPLPRYPITELYEPQDKPFIPGRALVDQAFLYCTRCGHGKVETIIPPAELYGPQYRTRTTASIGASQSVSSFFVFIVSRPTLNFYDFIVKKRPTSSTYVGCDFSHLFSPDLLPYETVIDIGGNDASLVGLFPCPERVIVDPHGSDAGQAADAALEGEGGYVTPTIIKSFVEDADLSAYKAKRKIIVCSHTLEHIENPHSFFAKVCSILCHDDLVALQFPLLELLVNDYRINQIQHQHIHYFSQHSIKLLLNRYGLEIINSECDHDHYGSLRLLCRKGAKNELWPSLPPTAITHAHGVFRSFMERMDDAIIHLSEVVGLGAALMLPVLHYWLPSISRVEYIADDDPSKEGLRYVNFNKRITGKYDLWDRNVVLTAIGTKLACRRLTNKAFSLGARNVVVPAILL